MNILEYWQNVKENLKSKALCKNCELTDQVDLSRSQETGYAWVVCVEQQF